MVSNDISVIDLWSLKVIANPDLRRRQFHADEVAGRADDAAHGLPVAVERSEQRVAERGIQPHPDTGLQLVGKYDLDELIDIEHVGVDLPSCKIRKLFAIDSHRCH